MVRVRLMVRDLIACTRTHPSDDDYDDTQQDNNMQEEGRMKGRTNGDDNVAALMVR